ncbi:MAG: glucosamine-6-phosphate deaminase [Caldilineales bacterium]|nr:glucosamine-6-phosphate deaminase [Caldilineales bacterium]
MTTKPIFSTQAEFLDVSVYESNEAMGKAAAHEAVAIIREAIRARGMANVILATGNSQLTFLEELRGLDIDWPKVNVFHMDEYIGLPAEHPASFPVFLQRHFLDFVNVGAFYPVEARTGQLEQSCANYAEALREHPADLCAMGIGENGHIAFNDPPFAEFADPVWVKVVRLDEMSRRQQVGEGHYASLAEVPTHAITVTIPALLSAGRVLCIVPETRKAAAVARALTGPIDENCPASILRRQSHVHLYLDADAASDLHLA